jgi:hypothetical protein
VARLTGASSRRRAASCCGCASCASPWRSGRTRCWCSPSSAR